MLSATQPIPEVVLLMLKQSTSKGDYLALTWNDAVHGMVGLKTYSDIERTIESWGNDYKASKMMDTKRHLGEVMGGRTLVFTSPKRKYTPRMLYFLPFCAHCRSVHVTQLCTECGVTYFCSTDCQLKEWKTHRSTCFNSLRCKSHVRRRDNNPQHHLLIKSAPASLS